MQVADELCVAAGRVGVKKRVDAQDTGSYHGSSYCGLLQKRLCAQVIHVWNFRERNLQRKPCRLGLVQPPEPDPQTHARRRLARLHSGLRKRKQQRRLLVCFHPRKDDFERGEIGKPRPSHTNLREEIGRQSQRQACLVPTAIGPDHEHPTYHHTFQSGRGGWPEPDRVLGMPDSRCFTPIVLTSGRSADWPCRAPLKNVCASFRHE